MSADAGPRQSNGGVYVMPPELYNEDSYIDHVRIDGPEDTRGKAKAFFASEWGFDFQDVRVVKRWYAPPEPDCDECGQVVATCGIEATWGGGGPTFTAPVCIECQAAMIKREEGIYARLSAATAKSLKEVEPYDGWPVVSATSTTPGAVAYWHGRDPDEC